MDFRWVLHVTAAFVATAFGLVISMALLALLSLPLPSGFDDALTLMGIFFAAMIGTLIYLPQITGRHSTALSPLFRSMMGVIFLSLVVAVACSIGGGTLRRLAVGQTTVFGDPFSKWWIAILYGWVTGLFLFFTKLDVYNRTAIGRSILDTVDAWVMGVFAVAGALTTLAVQPFGLKISNVLAQMLIAGCLGALTGAGGGLIARIISQITFALDSSKPISATLTSWALSQYTNIAFAMGVFSYIILISLRTLVRPVQMSPEAFRDISLTIDPKTIFNQTMSDYIDYIIPVMVFTDQGIYIMVYFISGFLACYMFRLGLNKEKLN